MSAEKPYEFDHVPKTLHDAFDGEVPPGERGDARERENNFLSRALAAYAVFKLSGCTLDEAAASLMDVGGDGGIDAAHHSPTSNTLWLVQSKFIENGRGEPELGDVSQFRDGVDNLLRGNWAAFETNAASVKRLPQIKKLFEDPTLRVRALLVYSGITNRGFSIVNGAQTLGTIHAAKTAEDGFVFLKIISLEKCDDETTFARRITESTHFQIGFLQCERLPEAQGRGVQES